ncbi:hypothetical protein CGL51_08550 [Pyrobaculum aerophilum]|uniref:Uncharacterized protein n=1 Tax=Pyrobaculum aerophilum TaxID=13773 RepID=A0A371QX47_9CREN|nr:hypothetical protein CGL51_08550 [Pyrobaculum aerophilum]RFA96735.1 hypothetical protein CGL52_10575 [Pyrobaculum aerophilum]
MREFKAKTLGIYKINGKRWGLLFGEYLLHDAFNFGVGALHAFGKFYAEYSRTLATHVLNAVVNDGVVTTCGALHGFFPLGVLKTYCKTTTLIKRIIDKTIYTLVGRKNKE